MFRLAGIALAMCAGMLVGCANSPDPVSTTEAGNAKWTESYDGAKAQAQAEKKLILADFTGSDWCHYCVQLKREVLNRRDFQKWADSRLVLLEVDYPRKKQAQETIAQNERLKETFNVDGYPTVLIMNADGKELGRVVGYDGAKEWSDEVRKLVDGTK